MPEDQPSDELRKIEQESKEVKRGLYGTNGMAIFESPSPEQLKKLGNNPRIEYFSYRMPGDVKETIHIEGEELEIREPAQVPTQPHHEVPLTDEDVTFMRKEARGSGVGGYLYSTFVTDFLATHIAQHSDKERVGIRGIAASIDGPVSQGRIELDDIQQIVADGAERGRNETLITTLDKTHPEIHYRTLQWLIQSPQEMRAELSETPEDAKKVFPVVLVYDLDKLRPGDKGGYSANLPEDPSERSKAILKAYILDFPEK